ncbi:hypothetical protein [Halorussus sp. AFM4]|uniref:hypothetical protein n=1 Tax=Halorussus sp. AFM4 TaxID=3421651 RepID=UPI003EBC3BC1
MHVEPGRAVGGSRLALFVGVLGLAAATYLGVPALAWGCLAVVAAAFGLNTVGKLRHYADLPVSERERRRLVASWVALAVVVVAFLANVVYTRHGAGDGSYYWALAVAGIGLGMVHRGLQAEYLGELAAESESVTAE